MTDHVIEVDGLTKNFDGFCAVDHIQFNVERGKIFGFLGPNGSGKTTTMRMLLGLIEPSAGRALVLGEDMAHKANEVRTRLGYMTQRFSLYNDLTVIENLHFYGQVYGLNNHRLNERTRFALEMADLVGRENEMTKNLSGGWRQRLALGAAILHQPDLLFLDEPTAGVDPLSRRAFWDLLYRLAAGGTTIFVTTHYMDEAENCEELAFIHNGHIIARGSPDSIKRSMMHGQVIELNPDDPSQAITLLHQIQRSGEMALEEVALYGAQVHVVAVDAESLMKGIGTRLRDQGIDPGRMSIIEPTLEDVFISCVREAEAE
jgi:ABC-2 type transport system ATP-binding protein